MIPFISKFEKVKVLNILNADAENTAEIINEHTKQGWLFGTAFLLNPNRKRDYHSVICVVLTKQEVDSDV